ncbi:phosphatidylinositol-specific phospholipase C1-like protein [Sphingobium sp. CR2-8]|uniref:phosphatidylinositol-specific phospholipase C1-like protein n=1 Tax=Sphingobium sp. CR2-8 TaxID=1306534 RepID=UPI002DC02B8A|nr:phosphatidylinositol-specific phospholipase C1-like protein [Sphingobium sp. CR2-8]MEC3909420.1 phosphatidylinositol-specific phospholipase C1-like protein [Sphingobium sp. CR2-8]
MIRTAPLFFLLAGIATGTGAAALAMAPHPAHPLRLNDVTAVGTHNSYKQAMTPEIMARLRAAMPEAADALDYEHRPLTQQLDHGARQLEIDVNYDPQGGHYARRSNNPDLDRPGFKVLHIPGIDDSSHCVLLTQCLRQIKAWSDAHADHIPILLMFNAKDGRNSAYGGIDPLPFDEAAYDALDTEIRSILPPEKLIVPDDVQGRYPTLRDAVLANNWPVLDKARGRFLLALDEPPAKVAVYRGKRRSLEGRVFFINTDEQSPAAAYLTINDPIRDGARIARDVATGYLVRTRADENTVQARANDTSRRAAALASGAQYISTDYLWPDPRFAGGYQVSIDPDMPVRCNPVRKPRGCTARKLETK